MQTFHFRSYFQFLKRNKLYTAINVVGFAVSLTFVILTPLYLRQEYKVDAFQEHQDRIYRMVYKDGATWSPASAGDLAARYPEIEKTLRIYPQEQNVRIPGQELTKAEALLVDTTFFSFFSFNFVEGSPATAMRTPQDIVISESMARKLFGDQPAVGQALEFENERMPVGIISGVVRDFRNSHIRETDILLPFENMSALWGVPDLLSFYNMTFHNLYVMTHPGADLQSKMVDMHDYLLGDQRYFSFREGANTHPTLEPLREVYFSKLGGYMLKNDPVFLSVLAIVVVLILFFAVINYVNLSVAQVGFRAKESATRRLLGGTRWELFSGFISESVLFCFASLVLAFGMAVLAEPWFREALDSPTPLLSGLTFTHVLIAVAGIAVLGVVSGCLPGLSIAGFKPIEVVRGTFKRKTKMVYSKVLIGFQYCMTIALIGCTIVIIRQMNYMQQNLGVNTDYIIEASNVVSGDQQAGFRDQLLAIPGVEQVSFADAGFDNYGNRSIFTNQDDVQLSMANYRGDSVFMEMMGIEILSRTGINDRDAYWLNETLWKKAGLKEGDTEIRFPEYDYTMKIKGVIRNFHFEDFTNPVTEARLQELAPGDRGWNVYIRVSEADPFGTMKRLETVFNERAGGQLFDGEFLGEQISFMYKNQQRLSSFMGSLSLVAIVISAMGMLAMATYFLRQRSQEVAVRKVFGALNKQVLGMLMFSFLKLVVIAFVVAVPIIWYLMQKWLTGYSYRISLSWEVFVVAGMTTLIVAGVTVFWQAWKTANRNPVLSLKD